uniref:Transposase n=1 Tax=Caenorhabditis tropicalis TaxID=1561998 RepID=A0A1I7UW50_9PELO
MEYGPPLTMQLFAVKVYADKLLHGNMSLESVRGVADCRARFPSEKSIVDVLMSEGYFESEMKCDVCQRMMTLRNRGESMEVRL